MKSRRILGVGLAAVVVIGAVVLAVGGPAALYSARARVSEDRLPADVVSDFYDWYLGSIDLQAGRNPLIDRAYRSSELLSEDFVAQVDALLDSFERGGYDPFLLAQDVPAGVEVGEEVVSGDTAQVRVETNFEGHALLVTLKRLNDAWRINGVALAPEMRVRSFYDRYLAHVDNEGGAMQNPLVDGFYRDCPELSEAFVAEVDETIASLDRGGFDPILLAQDVPVEIVVSEAELSAEEVLVTVEMFWGGNPKPSERLVTLNQIDGDWKIVDVSSQDSGL